MKSHLTVSYVFSKSIFIITHFFILVLISSIVLVVTKTSSNMFLPPMNVDSISSMSFSNTFFNLFASTFETILYMHPTRNIVLYFLKCCGFQTLGISDIKVSLHPLGHWPNLWKSFIVLIMTPLKCPNGV